MIDSGFNATGCYLSWRECEYDSKERNWEGKKEQFSNGNQIEYFKNMEIDSVHSSKWEFVYSFTKQIRSTPDVCECERIRGRKKTQIEKNHQVISMLH